MDKENRSGSGDQTGRNTVITKAARKKLVMARSGIWSSLKWPGWRSATEG